jgi:hypothetical protein
MSFKKFKVFFSFNWCIPFKDKLYAENEPLEKLFDKLFKLKEYKKGVRPTLKNSHITRVESELKLLQIDLVIFFCIILIILNFYNLF